MAVGAWRLRLARRRWRRSPARSVGRVLVLSGADLDSIRSIASKDYDMDDYSPKGTLFATPGSESEKQALEEVEVSNPQTANT